ncbi:MAG TPA: DsbA family oxidoreductase [Vicinamibacterales bacterium]|nr:DsbA family oxidoreductase [Vicinamibacterales bacterium]
MHIDIWSDVVCPWCYLGKRRLEKSLASFEGRGDMTIAHRSFQLDPTRPKGETTSRRTMLMSKYRLTEDRVRAMDHNMESMAAAEGLAYHLTEKGQSGNTLDAHRLVHLAASHDREDQMLERLYKAYFTEQRSIFNVESLVSLALEEGLDATEVREALESDRYVDAVSRDLEEARMLGVTGVPFFVIDGRYGISGAQATDMFTRALAMARQASESPPR